MKTSKKHKYFTVLYMYRGHHTRIQGGNIVGFENIMMAAAINSQVNSGTVKVTF